MTVEFQKADVATLYQEAGFKNAGRWKPERLKSKLTEMVDSIGEDQELSDASESLLDLIINAMDKEEDIVVVEAEAPPKKSPRASRGASSPKQTKASTNQTKASTKQTKASTTKADGGGKKPPAKVGVITTIGEFIAKKDTERKAVTKDEIVAHLAKQFPDREESALKSTVAQQVPTKLNKKDGFNIVRTDEGKYFNKK